GGDGQGKGEARRAAAEPVERAALGPGVRDARTDARSAAVRLRLSPNKGGGPMVGAAAQELHARDSPLVNIEIRSMAPEREASDPDEWDFFCECGKCRDRVRLRLETFDRQIADDELVLAPRHIYAAAAEARRVAQKLRSESHALQAQARQAVLRAHQG